MFDWGCRGGREGGDRGEWGRVLGTLIPQSHAQSPLNLDSSVGLTGFKVTHYDQVW